MASQEQLKYREAVERLDEIISQLENEDVDVDELSMQVKEAVDLIRVCKAKIDKAEMEVKQVVEDFAKDLGQAILVSHLDMMTVVLDFLGIANENGFFAKDIDAKPHLTEGWQARTFEQFKSEYPESLLLFYINHLGCELGAEQQAYLPAA